MTSTTEPVKCINQCSDNLTVAHTFGQYAVCKCNSCSLVFLNPRLAEALIPSLYEEQYFKGTNQTGYADYAGDRAVAEKTFTQRINFIRRFKKVGAVLDIGCSLGFFLDVAERHGFEGWGLDCSNYAVNECQIRFPNRVMQGVMDDKVFADQSFDVVTMFDVFEHIYDPIDFLRNVHRVLKKDGIVVISTPNQNSWLAKLTGQKWVSYKIPEHVYYYTPQTLSRVVSSHFSVATVKPDGQYCSIEFLSNRIEALNKFVGLTIGNVAKVLGVLNAEVFVPCGSMTVILQPKVASESHPISSHDEALPELVR